MKRQLVVLSALVPITVLVALDVVDDYRSGVSNEHLLIQVALSILGLIAIAFLTEGIVRARMQVGSLQDRLATTVAEAENLRAETQASGKEVEICERQFREWQLSPAESEVARLLLRGLAYQDIAISRKSSEGTIRQQAVSIYRKAGVGGRSELAGFFLANWLRQKTHSFSNRHLEHSG